MKITFPGGLRVDVLHEGFSIQTDQPVSVGGEATAPSPFDLFLASIGACAGFYALRFCQQRHLDTEGLSLTATPDWEGKHVVSIRIEVTLPATFPERYHDAIVRSIDQCAVKRHLAAPPRFDVRVIPGARAAKIPIEELELAAPR